MVKVFLSYRREDAQYITGRIYDRLGDHFGKANIFMDVDGIPLGSDFRKVLQDAVGGCDVFLAVIGPGWLNAAEGTQRRLDNASDFVRIEIEAALKRGIAIIPLLLGRAAMPRAEQLPSTLQDLAFQNGMPLRPDPDFHRDMERLIRSLEGAGVKTPVQPSPPAKPELTKPAVAAPKFFTLEEAAQRLALEPENLEQMATRGEIRSFRDGSNWKFRIKDIEERLATMPYTLHSAPANQC